MIGLAKLRSLRALDVSHTDFNGHGLEIVVDDLPLLRALNISATRVRDISALRKCANRLTSLSVYNLSFGETSLSVVQQLPLLEALDVSDDSDNPLDALATRDRHHVRQLLQSGHLFARLQELDISGRDGVDCALVTRFLAAKHAAAADALPLRFLGLLQTSVASDDLAFGDADLVVSGNASEKQILEALRRYGLRANFVQKSLFHLYAFTQTLADARADLIEAVVAPMAVHSRAIAVQMAATACLYNLSKNQFGDRLHPSTLRAVVERTLAAMQNFPNHQQLQKNSLLTICSDRVLQDVSFDRFLCTQLVLDSLVQFKDTAMNRMAVAIVSILAAKISTAETSVLGAKAVYMEALLAIVRARLADALHNDIMLKFTLSALWNLTDESPKTCQMFLQKGGLDLYLQVLQVS